jgi:putative two-component system response regulator
MSKLLIIEDSEMLCSVFERLLNKYTDFDFTIAKTYAQAQVYLRSKKYRLAVADMNLPDAENGEIIALLNMYNIAPIVFTGIFDEEFRDGFETAYIVDYLLKERYESIIQVINKLKQLEENRNKTVLIVDDSPTYIDYLKQNLQIHNFKILTANNGEDALEVLDKHPEIELMITDYHMPIMDGLELVRSIRKKRSIKNLSIIVLTSETNSYTTSRFLKEGVNDYITKPFSRDEFYSRIYHNIETTDLFERMLVDFDDDIITLLCELTEFKCFETSLHVKRIKMYTYELAKLYGIFEDEAKVISKMALLHDIGKILTPDYILAKPSKLTYEEHEIIKRHTILGGELLKKAFKHDSKMGKSAEDIATYHHENWDGSGYPEGRKGFEIPIAARIVAIVDVFDALMHNRVYKKAWGLEETLAEIEKNNEIKFEPKLVKLFLLNIDIFLKIIDKYK